MTIMGMDLKPLRRGDPIPAELINELIRRSQRTISVSGMSCMEDANGWRLVAQKGATGPPGTTLFIASVVSNATGGGYYNCYLQELNAGADWNTDSKDILDNIGSTVVVLNLAEHNSTTHNLSAGSFIVCWQETDVAESGSQGEVYIGSPIKVAAVTVVTDVQVDTDNMLVQKKTRSIWVLTAGVESDWTTVEGGEGDDCT